MLALIGGPLLCLATLAQPALPSSLPDNPNERLLYEQRHFLECLACVYRPEWWLSYNDSLYFQPRTAAQLQQLEVMKAERSKYLALTNRETRYDLTAKLVADSGIGEAWKKKVLLPFSSTNQNLTPTLGRAIRVVPRYKVLDSATNGDALIQDGGATYFVMNFGRGADDASGTNALLIKEGTKTFASGTRFKTVEAFSDAGLSPEEKAVLNRVAAAFQKQAAALAQEIAGLKGKQEFEDCKARATDSNPYMEYLLAQCYLEGKGTPKDEALGLQWMKRAANSGSGDATAYLEKLGHKTP